jgi:hypothetical protein
VTFWHALLLLLVLSSTETDVHLVPRSKTLPLVERANAYILYHRGLSGHIQDDMQKASFVLRSYLPFLSL